jgi:hypothetical protein
MAPVASADVMAITKWSISRLENGMAGCCAYAASGQALSANCTRRHLRIKMKELTALARGPADDLSGSGGTYLLMGAVTHPQAG